MPEITIEAIGESKYRVTVEQGGATTKHTVTATRDDVARYGGAETSAERLIEGSFRFLLQREPASAILSTFALPTIERYFPEYPREIRKML